MRRVVLLLVPILVVAGPDHRFSGNSCLDPFTNSMRADKEVWEMPGIPCSRVLCSNGIVQNDACTPPPLYDHQSCTVLLNEKAPFPDCCPIVVCSINPRALEPGKTTDNQPVTSNPLPVTTDINPSSTVEPTVSSSPPTELSTTAVTESQTTVVTTVSTPATTEPPSTASTAEPSTTPASERSCVFRPGCRLTRSEEKHAFRPLPHTAQKGEGEGMRGPGETAIGSNEKSPSEPSTTMEPPGTTSITVTNNAPETATALPAGNVIPPCKNCVRPVYYRHGYNHRYVGWYHPSAVYVPRTPQVKYIAQTYPAYKPYFRPHYVAHERYIPQYNNLHT